MAVVKNLTVDKYSSFEKMFTFLDKSKTPFDLTGYTATSQIRKYHDEDVVASFSCEVILPATYGKIIIRLSHLDTANTDPGKYLYDILLSSNTETIRAVEGVIEITPNITK